MRRRLYATAAALSVLALVALVWVLTDQDHHRTGTNGMARIAPALLTPGGQVCQGGEFPATDTGQIRFYPVPGEAIGPLEVELVSRDGRPLGTATVAASDYERTETAVATIAPLREAAPDSVVCIRNNGPRAMAVLGDVRGIQAGSATPVPPPAEELKPPFVRMRFDYHLPEAESWWSFASTVAERFGLVKATFFGSWTLWATIAALLALAFGTIWYAAREIAR